MPAPSAAVEPLGLRCFDGARADACTVPLLEPITVHGDGMCGVCVCARARADARRAVEEYYFVTTIPLREEQMFNPI